MAADQPARTLTIQLPPLTPTMKAAFVAFYEDTVNGVEPTSGTFDEAAFAFFDEKGTDPGAVDEFFNAFTPLWTQRLSIGAWGPAAAVWTSGFPRAPCASISRVVLASCTVPPCLRKSSCR